MAKRRKRGRPTSPTTKRRKSKPKSSGAVLCFQDVWKEYCSKSLAEDEEDMDTQISNVFFELANAPSVSYRLEALPPSSDRDATDTTEPTIDDDTKHGTTSSNTIVIQQDVLGAAQNHTGGIVWETSYLLLNYLLTSQEWLDTGSSACGFATTPTTVLEIGAGCGMLGLSLHTAFQLGILERNVTSAMSPTSSRVILTETNEVMGNLRGNFERNYPSPSSEEVTEKPPPVARHQISVEELDWTRFREDCARAKIEAHSIDCLVGTDVVFSTRFVLPMLETMRFLSHPRTVVYLCLQERCKDSHRLLLREANNFGFCVEDISETVYQDERLARYCRFGRALECKLLRFTVVAVERASVRRDEKKKPKKEKEKKRKK